MQQVMRLSEETEAAGIDAAQAGSGMASSCSQ